MTVYLGPVGSLVALPDPYYQGVDPGISGAGGTHQLLGGGRVRDRVGTPRRTYTVRWQNITADQAAVIEGFYLGAYGPGPFVLLDPNRRNYFTANQSTGTDVLRDATGFVLAAGSTAVDSSAVQTSRGLRALRMSIGIHAPAVYAVISGSTVSTTTASTTVDIPVIPSSAYRVSLRAYKLTSVDTFTLTMGLRYYTAAGAITGSDFTTTPTLANNTWAAYDWGGTSPSDAALARIYFLNGAATTVANTIYLDDLQLEQAAAATTWAPGSGVPRVTFESFSESYPFGTLRDVEVVLLEV